MSSKYLSRLIAGGAEQVADDEHGNGAVGGNHEGPEHSAFGENLVIPFLAARVKPSFSKMRMSVW